MAIGGGIYCEAGAAPAITYCTITNNSSYAGGGGINVYGWTGFSEATISNCTITGNYTFHSEAGGGGIECSGGKVTINQCTIAGNSAEFGGGFLLGGPSLGNTISNTIIWGNDAWDGPQIAVTSYDPGYVADLTVLYCDIQGGQAEGDFSDSGLTLNWGPGNIDVDPCFADTLIADYHLKIAGRTMES